MMTRQRLAVRGGLLGFVLAGVLWWAGCQDAVGPRWVQTIDIGPDSLHLVPGESGVFRVFRVRDQDGNELSDEWIPRVKWTTLNPTAATFERVEEGVSVTALSVGIAAVRAELGRGREDASVYISPAGLGHFEIDPSPVTVSLVSGWVRAYARLFDTAGVPMDHSGFRFSWAVADTTLAYIPNQLNSILYASIRGRRVGQTRLRLTVSGRTESTDLFVISEPLPPVAPTVNPVSSTSLALAWGAVSGSAAGYRVYRSMSAGGTYSQVGSTGSGVDQAYRDTTFVDTGLTPSTVYFYEIEACHPVDGCSERSPPGSGTTAAGG
ncbi:MAG: fibronectin type III domain-containing protein [Gemmatimonadota bacterium]|jgi:hypothetical protein